jgi:ABC-2 type transport system permease protein
VVLILEGMFEITFKGNVPMIVAAGSLFVIAYLALGALLQLLVRDLATGLGLTGVVVSPKPLSPSALTKALGSAVGAIST